MYPARENPKIPIAGKGSFGTQQSKVSSEDIAYMRVQFMRGARTVLHTDSFRGGMKSSLILLKYAYKLIIQLFPSVILIHDFLCISFHLDKEIILVVDWLLLMREKNQALSGRSIIC